VLPEEVAKSANRRESLPGILVLNDVLADGLADVKPRR
jgi:hypothetical protein